MCLYIMLDALIFFCYRLSCNTDSLFSTAASLELDILPSICLSDILSLPPQVLEGAVPTCFNQNAEEEEGAFAIATAHERYILSSVYLLSLKLI